MKLSETDIRFLVETVATKRQDHEHVVQLVKEKDDFLEQMLEDPKLAGRILNEDEAYIHISPYMLFSVLLRQVRRDLKKESYINEVGVGGQQIPVFEAPQVAELLDEKSPRDYLIDMLSSFSKTRNTVAYWMERGKMRRRHFSDMDMDDMIQLCRQADPEARPMYYRRIADIALFLAGVFPEHASHFAARPRSMFSSRRTLTDYERDGQTFYDLAARESRESTLGSVYRTLSEKFTLARRALNVLSERYMMSHRVRHFGLSTG